MTSLSDQHRHMLEVESGISDEVIAARGYRTVETKAALERLGFAQSQRLVPGLLIPVHGVTGELVTHQLRPDSPRWLKGKRLRYETPSGSRMGLDVPPMARQHLGTPTVPLWITEGAKKADAAVTRGAACVAILGVWNWRGTNDQGGKTVLADLEAIALNGRDVMLAFDSDVVDKDPVWLALTRLGAVMEARGASVRVVRIPNGEAGAKVGLDDYLVAGGTLEALRFTAQPLSAFEKHRPSGPYRFADGCTFFSPDSETDRKLANFTARIVTDVVLDNGADTTRAFEIEATLRGRTKQFVVPAERFGSLNWTIEELGPTAIVSPGQSSRDHLRVAIQTLSGDIPERREYTHTGWAEIDGRRLYLTKDGGIGADGLDSTVAVRLTGPLEGYQLPEPPDGEELVQAIRSSLSTLELAPIEVIAPIYLGAFRAPIGQVDFGIHISGQTGTGKSELAAIALQHFGPAFNARNLSASWMSTSNANEGLGFAAKDALLVLDDFAPAGSRLDVQRLHGGADRIFRGLGNNTGRARMRTDTSVRNSLRIRALVLSTGEDVPKGASVVGRMMVIDLQMDAIRWDRLTACQRQASAGVYAQAMAGYVRWLARNPGVVDRFRQYREEYLPLAATPGAHKRTAGIVADLAATARVFCEFTIESCALTKTEAKALRERLWNALTLTSARQSSFQAAQEPTQVFREYLSAAITAGRAHLATCDGSPPDDAIHRGWKTAGTGEYERLEPQGDLVGWVVPDGLLLEPRTAFAVAQSMAQRSGESISISEGRLRKSLSERGLLVATETHRGTLTVRKRIGGRDVAVLHVSPSFLDTGTSLATQPTKPTKPTNGDEMPSNYAGNSDERDRFEPTNEQSEPTKPTNGRTDSRPSEARTSADAPVWY